MKLTCSNHRILSKLDVIGKDHDKRLHDVRAKIVTEQQEVKNIQMPDLSEKLLKCHPGFVVAFDNIDLHIARRNMTLAFQNRDVHWVNHTMVENRVSGNHLSSEGQKADLMEMPNILLFPSIVDQKRQHFNYIILVSRILVNHFSAFENLKDACIRHIPFKYSKEMSKKSLKVYNIYFHLFIF